MTNEIKIVFPFRFRFVPSFCHHFSIISIDLFESVQKTKRIQFQYFLNIFFLRSVQASIPFIHNKDSFSCFNEMYPLFWRFLSLFNHRKLFCAKNGTKIEKNKKLPWNDVVFDVRNKNILFNKRLFRTDFILYFCIFIWFSFCQMTDGKKKQQQKIGIDL